MSRTQEFGYPEAPFAPPDPEMFQRVWKRVMSCGEQEEKSASAPAQPPSATLPVPLPTPELSPNSGCEGECFGAGAARCAPMLEELLDEICVLAQLYRSVMRQVQGGAARQIRCLAEEQQRQFKQLNVVCFLLTGERFIHRPQRLPACNNVSDGLRELFLREQQCGCIYQRAAAQVQDICLKELLEEFAADTRLHTNMIRKILEGM